MALLVIAYTHTHSHTHAHTRVQATRSAARASKGAAIAIALTDGFSSMCCISAAVLGWAASFGYSAKGIYIARVDKLGLWRFNGVTYAPNDNSFLRNLFAILAKEREKRRG